MAKSRITIIGTGLIGGSIGLALKKAKVDLEIVGHDKDSGAAARAQKRGAVDKSEWNLINACDGAGLIVLAIPLDGIKPTLDALKPHLAPGVMITDTATTKLPLLEWAADLPKDVHFVGGDPVLKPNRAKPESGIDHADADLFQGASYCLTPSTRAASEAVDMLAGFVTLLGAKPYFIDAAEHDGLMTGVQHMPAVLATALAAATIQSQGWRELSRVAGADFRAATELAPTDGKTAREQFFAHRTDLIRWIDGLTTTLGDLRGVLERQDATALESLIGEITLNRDKWLSESEHPASATDWEGTQFSPARFFLGGLADVGKKRK